MARPKEAIPRKKSVSKAPASKGRADSRAVNLKRQQEARSREAHQDPVELAEVYGERAELVEQRRKIKRNEKPDKRKS